MFEIMVSGYGGGESKSISKYRISEDWQTVEEVWHDNIEAPSYLSTFKDMCFAITERENAGKLYCYKRRSHGYIPTDKMDLNIGALCYIHYSPKHRTLFGASYESGHVIAVSVDEYKLSNIKSLFVIPPDNDIDITRAHCCVPDNDESRLFVCNIALDRVYIYNIENGFLSANDTFHYIQLEKGNGPRHIRFHPKLDVAYVITEYSNKIIALNYNRLTGELEEIQQISALPESYVKKSYCSSLVISSDGKYLYSAIRGANAICVFQINDEGKLIKLQEYDCCGKWPRHIEITADDRFLMSANQKSDEVAVISISKVSGRLESNVAKIPFKAPGYAAEI